MLPRFPARDKRDVLTAVGTHIGRDTGPGEQAIVDAMGLAPASRFAALEFSQNRYLTFPANCIAWHPC